MSCFVRGTPPSHNSGGAKTCEHNGMLPRAPYALLMLIAVLASAQPTQTMFPPVRGLHEMVGAANNLEVEAGFRMLAQGGNAIDAGVAATLTAVVTEQSRVGLGG